jgi:hypothetical protein
MTEPEAAEAAFGDVEDTLGKTRNRRFFWRRFK